MAAPVSTSLCALRRSMKTPKALRRYTELPFLVDYLSSGELFLPSPKTWDDRNDSYYLEQYAKLENVDETYALCLTGASETYHHWRVFSSGSSGVCIDFNIDKFKAACGEVPNLISDFVNYKKITELQNQYPDKNELPFLKRHPFRDEIEYRLFIASNEPVNGGVRIPMPLDAINYIHISPWLHDNVADKVKKLLKSIEDCQNIKMYKSTLIENQKWKKYGTKST